MRPSRILYHITVVIPVPGLAGSKAKEERIYTRFGAVAAARCVRDRVKDFPTASVTSERQGPHVRQPVCP